jgi:alpha-mannosidase
VVSNPTTDNAEQAEHAETSIERPAGSASSRLRSMESSTSFSEARRSAFGAKAAPLIVVEPAIAMTLIRAVGDLSRNDLATRPSGHAGPPVATPAAQCLGVQRFELAFEPHGPLPQAGELMSSARAQNIPPRVVVATRHDGNGPLTRTFLRIDRRGGNVVLSALKQAEDRLSTIVRLFNPGDEAASVVLRVDAPIAQAFAVNFLEERQTMLPVEDGGIGLVLAPKQIQTIEMV